jgi:predicted transcriptional regulator
MSKEAVFTLKLETDLRDAFAAEAAATHRPASELVRAFMREFVKRQRQAREHDAWFRAKIKEAMVDAGPGIPDDVVMGETLAIIDRIAIDRIVNDRIVSETQTLSPEERAVAFEAWSAGHRSTALLSDHAVSRDGMYEGRDR